MASSVPAEEPRTVVLGALPDPPPTSPPADARARPAGQRIEALDFVRGAALLGILLMNIIGFGLPDAYNNPNNAGGATGLNLLAWIVAEISFEGTQRALFSMLFGASVILLTSRLEAAGRKDATDIYFRRNMWLMGFGLVNAFLFLWMADILFAYGVAGMFLYVFRNLPARKLLAIGGFVLLLSAAWNLYDTLDLMAKHDAFAEAAALRDSGAALTPQQDMAIFTWENARTAFKSPPENVQQASQAMQGGYWSAFLFAGRVSIYFQTWGLYRFFFDAMGMMLIGMGLFRAGILTLERRPRVYVALMLIGYAIGLGVNFAEIRWIMTHHFSALSFAQADISYDIGRLATTMGHLGALLLFVHSGMLGVLRRAIAAVGQMAVTNYMMQSVICTALFVGLGWYNQLERHQLYYVVAAVWAWQILFSVVWLTLFRFGPVEWLWRSLTYIQPQPMRREDGRTAS